MRRWLSFVRKVRNGIKNLFFKFCLIELRGNADANE